MMQLALFAPFMEADLLAERILAAAPRQQLQINECNLQDYTLDSEHLEYYDMAVIAYDGAKGMEAVRMAREHAKNLPIIWMTNDTKFSLIGYSLQVTAVLDKDCTLRELSDVIGVASEGR